MKWNRFSVSILVGVVSGAMIALFFGNTLSAVLAGILVAGICTGLMSINWRKAQKGSIEHVAGFIGGCEKLVENISSIAKIQKRQKEFAFLVTVFFLSFIPIFSIVHIICSLNKTDSFLFALLFLSASLLFSRNAFQVLCYLVNVNSKIETLHSEALTDMLDDNRSALSSLVYMLAIRTVNAFYLLIFLCMLVPYLLLSFATNKTRLSIATAMVFSSIHLVISYWQGWISAENLNFWLSLGVACVLGIVIGQLIYKWVPKEDIEFPEPNYLMHLPK